MDWAGEADTTATGLEFGPIFNIEFRHHPTALPTYKLKNPNYYVHFFCLYSLVTSLRLYTNYILRMARIYVI